MQTQIAELYQLTKEKYQLRLLGGKSGLCNTASWLYLAEDAQNFSFLKGGELIITTGLFTQSGTTLQEFLRLLVLENCSGAILNTGKYLQETDVGPDILAFCEMNRFPLFVMPWEMHLADIMQDLCRLFLNENRREDQIDTAFQALLDGAATPEKPLRLLNQTGFPTDCAYQVLAVSGLPAPMQITSALNAYGYHYHLLQKDNLHILILRLPVPKTFLHDCSDTICYCDSISLGIGVTAESLANLALSYKCARFALAAAQFWKQPLLQFAQLGPLRLLFHIDNPAFLQTYAQEHLGVLEQYDQKRNTTYLETLKVYLQADCSLLRASAQLHMHRNTLVYRIQKIKELLHTDFSDATEKLELLLSFYIREYLSI